jgi:hypothetical protein
MAPSKYGVWKVEYNDVPDYSQYVIMDSEECGEHLVLKVKYEPFKGETVVLVYLHTSIKDALKWRVIDPRFRLDAAARPTTSSAPGPDAHFPPTNCGWTDALTFVKYLGGRK